MTDEKLVDYLDELASRTTQQESTTPEKVVSLMADYLESKIGSGNGIGHGFIYKLRKELDNAIKDGVFGEA